MNSKEAFMKYVSNQLEKRVQAIINIMIEAGQRAVTAQLETRTSSGVYITQTGNLQASIGFAVLYNGREVTQGGFEGTKEGQRGGKELIKKLSLRPSKGITLVVVAGMNYAVYVEDMGLNVLTTAELTADKIVKQINKKLNDSIRN